MSKEFLVEINTTYTDENGIKTKRLWRNGMKDFNNNEIDILKTCLPGVFSMAKSRLPEDGCIVD